MAHEKGYDEADAGAHRVEMNGEYASPSIARCDYCGGPALWTFIQGEAHFICKAPCEGFRTEQGELFGSSRVRKGKATTGRRATKITDPKIRFFLP